MISICIVNWNTGRLLRECLQALHILPTDERALIDQVVVIDNASTDDSFSLAQENHYHLPLIWRALQKNIGFARANNLGMRLLGKDNQCSHLLLLNPDTAVQPGAIKVLNDFLEAHPRVGIVGPHLLNPDGSHQDSVRRFPSLMSLSFLFLKLHRVWPKADVWQDYLQQKFDYRKSKKVDQIMGAAFLIRDTLWCGRNQDKVGQLDKNFYLWFEEVDYCKRAIERGWEVWYTPKAKIKHWGGVSFNQLIGVKRGWPFIKSALYYSRKHLDPLSYLFLLTLVPWAWLLAAASSWHHYRLKHVADKHST